MLQLKDLLRCIEAVKHLAPTNTLCSSILKDWHIVEEIVGISHIPFEITTILETATLTLSDLFGILLKMEFKMQKFTSNATRSTELAVILLEKVSERKINLIINPAMICAVFLDPRYCLDLSSNEIKIAKLTLQNFHEKLMQRQENIRKATENEKGNDSYEEYRAAKRKRLSLPMSEDNGSTDETNIMLLLEKYERHLPEMKDRSSILAYWESRKEADPVLYQLASMVNTISPT